MNLKSIAEHFSNSEADTIVFCREDWSHTPASAKVHVVECAADFSALPEEIVFIKEIKAIRFENFRGLDVARIFTMLSEMSNLEEIYFYRSWVKNIPPQIGKMQQLQRLSFEWDIAGNLKSWEMRDVPPEFGELENLRALELLNSSSFHGGFPVESANLHNLKFVKVAEDQSLRSLPRNIDALPALEHLYVASGKLEPAEIDVLLEKSKTIRTITLTRAVYRFEELSKKYPHVEFLNDGDKFAASLTELQRKAENLPPPEEWLKIKRSDTENAQYAYLLMKKHFAASGIELKKTDAPMTLTSFGWQFYLNVDSLLTKPEYHPMLRRFFDEITNFYEAISGAFFASNLLGMLEHFIDRDPPRSRIVPLLPEKALAELGRMNEILGDRHENYMEQLNQMGY